MSENKKLIICDYKVMLGKPTIKGSRITVVSILNKLSEGLPPEDILKIYPHLNFEQIMACIEFTADVTSNENIIDVA